VSLEVKASVMGRGEIGIFALKGQNARGIEYDWKVVNVKDRTRTLGPTKQKCEKLRRRRCICGKLGKGQEVTQQLYFW